MDLSIIIVSYNYPDELRNTLFSIFDNPPDLNYEVFVVDNASKGDNVKVIEEEFPQVRLIRNRQNIGFARANNQAIKLSKAEFILMLNPDIEVLDGSLNQLVDFMRRNPRASAAGGKLLYPDGNLQLSCRNFYTIPTIILRRTFLNRIFPDHQLISRHLMFKWDHNNIRVVDWVFGACLIVRRSDLDKIGFLDEGYFMYFEDVDLCYRLRQAGIKTYYVPQALFIHSHRRESASGLLNKKVYWHIKGMLRFYKKFSLTSNNAVR